MQEAFFEQITRINLRRMCWLIVVYLPMSAGFFAYNVSSHKYSGMFACQIADLVLSPSFLALGILALWRPGPLWWGKGVILCYYVYCMGSMDWYYFSSLPYFGDSPVYAIGAIMPPVLLIAPPAIFLPLLIGNHAVYLALVFILGKNADFLLSATLNGTIGAILGILAAWLLFSAKRNEFEKERMILDRNRELSEANAEMNEIMAIAAHDLRSPLHSMKMLFETVATRQEWRTEPYEPVVGAALRSCGNMLCLVSRLLDAHAAEHRAENGASSQRQCIRAGITGAILRIDPQARTKGINILLRMPDAQAEAVVDADALDEVLENLLSNGVKFSPPGSTVAVTLLAEETGWRIDVRDNGPGIPEDERQYLFGKFYRGKNRPTGGEPSTGMGLFIARTLMESMGGSLNYAPVLPHGSIFQIRFRQTRCSVPERGGEDLR